MNSVTARLSLELFLLFIICVYVWLIVLVCILFEISGFLA